jgi:hypothetical protein
MAFLAKKIIREILPVKAMQTLYVYGDGVFGKHEASSCLANRVVKA